MARGRSKKNSPAVSPRLMDPGPLAHQPFLTLKGLKTEEKPLPVIEPVPIPVYTPPDDGDLFQSAMSDVAPITGKKNNIRPAAPNPRRSHPEFYSEDIEALTQLEDLVAGRAQFDLVDTDEYLEGYVRGIHPIILEKLRKGLFSVQAHLDLHGLTALEAEEAVKDFISEALSLGYRCVLLIHGRGLNSKDHIPVLKKRLESILLRGPVKKQILAFTSARPVDGGAGASYVLLRARR